MELIRRADLDFLLFEWLDVEGLSRLDRFSGQTAGDYRAFLDLGERVALKEFLPSFKLGDGEEPRLTEDGRVLVQPRIADAVRAFFDAGLQLATVDVENGGLQLPATVATAVLANVMAANVAASAFPMLSIGNARVLTNFGTPAQIEAFAAPQFAGEALGTMCLSEPNAGSSLGDIVTRAEPDGEDALGRRYRVRGRKTFISAGGQDVFGNTIHLVLAKIPAPDGRLPTGAKGISQFVVPAVLPEALGGIRNDVVVAGLNHKMGYRGIPNTSLNFGEGREGALGWLVGQPGEGMRIMFQMMNEARINVGLGAAALAYRGYLQSRAYAAERRQGRPSGRKSDAPQVPILEHADVRRMLLAQKAIAEGALALCLYSAKLVDLSEHADDEPQRERAKALLDLLTPVTKTWPSEMGLVANHLAIQIHGGYGYTRDYDVEQIFRDNRLNPIHEGTTGIQALDLLGRKILFDGLRSVDVFMAALRDTAEAAATIEDLQPYAETLRGQAERIEALVREDAQSGDPAGALGNATPFLFAFGHLVVGWLWLDMARTAAGANGDDIVHRGKRTACRYFYEYEMPMIDAWLAPLRSRSDLATSIDESLL
jgi:alkylation response protein AidB-like acyl-CoA dehydrogenase